MGFGFTQRLLIFVALVASYSPSSLAQTNLAPEQQRLQAVIEKLAQSSTGKFLLNRALTHFGLKSQHELLQWVRLGPVSKTDAVLTRQVDPKTGQEVRRREVTVLLNGTQSNEQLILDLAHELTHATANVTFDPYDPDLTVGRYISLTIDGQGGEVEALTNECQVAFELSIYDRCVRYKTPVAGLNGQVNVDRIRQDFYRVGDSAHQELSRNLGPEKKLFPVLSPEKPQLYSSTGGEPYPVSLYLEYFQMQAVACENTKRRFEISRDPASQVFLARRCQNLDRMPAAAKASFGVRKSQDVRAYSTEVRGQTR